MRLPRPDPLGPLLAAAALVVLVLHGYAAELGRDVALYAYSGQRVADGVAPYVGVLNRAGPFGHLVFGGSALLARGLGTDDVLTMRAVLTALAVLSVWLVHVLGRELFGSRAAGAVAAATTLLFQQYVDLATQGPGVKAVMVPLALLSLAAVLRRHWGLAGVAVALSTLTWQPAFFFGAAAAAGTLLVLPRGERLRATARFAAGGILSTGALALAFWLWGALDDLVECFVTINATYTRQPTLWTVIELRPHRLYDGRVLDLTLLAVGLTAAVVLAAVRLRRLDRQDRGQTTRVGLGFATLVSLAWTLLFAFQTWGDAMVLVPPAALGVGGLVSLVRGVVGRRSASWLRAGSTVVAALTVAALGIAAYTSVTTRQSGLAEQRDQVAAVLAAAPPDPTVVSIGAPQALVLGGLVDPIRFQTFTAGLQDYFAATYPGGLAGVADLVESTRPTLITTHHLGKLYPWAEPLLRRDYAVVGPAPGFTWYARRDLGRSAIQELRQALRSAR